MARGVAIDNDKTREFLETCPAVESFQANSRDYIDFKYDPKQQPVEVPDGVYFSLSEAPF